MTKKNGMKIQNDRKKWIRKEKNRTNGTFFLQIAPLDILTNNPEKLTVCVVHK